MLFDLNCTKPLTLKLALGAGSFFCLASGTPSNAQDRATNLVEQAQLYEARTQGLKDTNDCLPVHMFQEENINVLYLHCSDIALANDGNEYKITDNFKATPKLARRFNFWRRIYSLWSFQQYVLHAADFPEVVLAIGDGSSLWEGLSESQKQRQLLRVMNKQRSSYASLLNQMHKLRKTPEKFNPAMKRVAKIMEHITASDKYAKAAASLRLQRGQREPIATGLATASRYFHAVEEAFAQEGLPAELAKIAFIESSFNLRARSKVGASGIYQIMPATGREFLIVNEHIDERNDPIKAAHAAAKILRLNYRMLGEWPLAITSYNHGPFGIKRATQSVGSNNIEMLIERYDGPGFGFASKNFYTGFLGLLATVSQADQLFPAVKQQDPIVFNEIKIERPIRIGALKKQMGLNRDDILALNPDIHRRFVEQNGTLPRGYMLKVPPTQFNEQLAATTSSRSDDN